MSEAAAPRPRLLYVEDDAEIAAMTLEVLRETYEVVHEADGLAGRDRALRDSFEVILLDRRLPGRDGAEIVRDLRTAHITTPVLLLTALRASISRAAVRAESRNGLRPRLPRPISTASVSSSVNPAGPSVADASITYPPVRPGSAQIGRPACCSAERSLSMVRTDTSNRSAR